MGTAFDPRSSPHCPALRDGVKDAQGRTPVGVREDLMKGVDSLSFTIPSQLDWMGVFAVRCTPPGFILDPIRAGRGFLIL